MIGNVSSVGGVRWRGAAGAAVERLPGTYRNDFFGDSEAVERDGGLAIVQGPKRIAFPMRHYDRDVFIYQPVGESAGGLSDVTFTIGPDQRAASVVVENLNIHDLGTFTRVTPSR